MRRVLVVIFILVVIVSSLIGLAESLLIDGNTIQAFSPILPFSSSESIGSSIKASKTAEGFWEIVQGEHKIGVRGEVCVTNGGEQPTENLKIIDVIQIKTKGSKYEDHSGVELDLGLYKVLGAGESHCYSYDFEVFPEPDANYRNVAYVTITNHSGWIPGGHNCPGPDLCEFGPAPKSGFEMPPPPDIGGDNISSPAEYLPDTGSPQDGDPEGKLIEIPYPTDAAPPGEPALPNPASPSMPGDNPPSPTEEQLIPTPTPGPTMDVSSLPTPNPVYPTPTIEPTEYTGPAGCTRPLSYWIDHPNKWRLEKFYLGDVGYNREQVLEILSANPEGDASYILAQQYITALLNIASPADPTAILDQLDQAVLWFQEYPLGSKPGNPGRKVGLQIAEALEAYNLGETGPGSCITDQAPVSPTEAFTPTSTSQPLPTLAPTMAPTPAPTPTPAAAQTLPTPASTP